MFREKRHSGMLVLIFLIPLHVATARFLISKPVLKVMYGNIGVISDMQIPPEDSRRTHVEMDFTIGDSDELPDFQEFLDEVEDMQHWNIKLNSTALDLDIMGLSEASKTLGDLKENLEEIVNEANTRRQLKLNLPHMVNNKSHDPPLLRVWYYQKMCLSYLIHIRFQVDTAVRLKMASQIYNGYKIGYLFYKLIRTKSQMYRIMDEWQSIRSVRPLQNRPNWRTKTHNFKLVLQMYERMLNLDVDMKDTVEMIKQALWKREMFQTQYVSPTTQWPLPKK